ncbi:MAG: N-acetylmuramoyl-L-alanine amidase [Elusimicrobiaceae bacterium]|nr:N-acetylmuramoyl-L-alanine amidase [Elusimicrobiaceae bacterium]
MKRTIFLIFSLFTAFLPLSSHETVAPYLPAQEKQSAAKNTSITVQYPYEKMHIARNSKEIFLFGQVNLPQPVTLDINGQSVEVYKNGAFVAFLPIQSGDFTFVLTATSGDKTVQAVRHIKVSGTNIKDYSQQASFDKEEIFPQRKVELLPADTVNLYVRGTPGAKVSAQLPNLKNAKNIVLKEDISRPGTYRAKFTIDPKQPAKSTKVVYKMTNGPDHSKAKITAPGKIYVRDAQEPYTYAQVTQPGVKIRKLPTASGNLYPDYRAYGTVRVSGEMANQYRLWLSDTEQAWLEKKHLKDTKNPEEVPNILSFIRTDTNEVRTRFVFSLNREVPIKIHEYNDRVELTLYYVDGFEQNFSLDDTSPVVSNIQWSEPAERAVAFRLQLRKDSKLWGHAYAFENNQLIVDLIHEPQRTATTDKPLAGTRIVIDAGHSPRRTVPYDGAIGPTGYLEYEATLALAQELKPKLEQAGATVIMTRHDNNTMSLQQRYKKALDENAHLFISLHYNALPDTVNPLARPRGFSVYYNYPHSFALAESVYKSFTKNVPLPDDGMIANDVLFIPRISQFPSILVENAYLILPQQEELARTIEGRASFVKALYEGIVNFYQPAKMVK